jgi:hypothetical protein
LMFTCTYITLLFVAISNIPSPVNLALI